MTIPDIDRGRRCEEHVGEAFPPRCAACDAENRTPPRSGYFPGEECDQHPGYPIPCDRCARDHADDNGVPVPIRRPPFTGTPALERRVRSHDPDESWSAADISTADANEVRRAVLAIIAGRGPITDEEIVTLYRAAGGPRTPQRVRTARAELSRPVHGEPLIREHDTAGTSSTGATARRWVLA